MTCDPCEAGCTGSEAMPELIAAVYPHLRGHIDRIIGNIKPPPVPLECIHCTALYWAGRPALGADAPVPKKPLSGNSRCSGEHSCPWCTEHCASWISCPTCGEDHSIPYPMEDFSHHYVPGQRTCKAPAFHVALHRIGAMLRGRFTGDQRKALVRYQAIYEVVALACPGRLHELVWTDGATVFRIAEDGTAADVNDEPVTPGPRRSWRLAKLKGEDLPRWRAVFLDYGLIPPLRIWGDA